MKKYLSTILCACMLLAAVPSAASAAELSCAGPYDQIFSGDTFTVDCYLDPQGVPVNALGGSLSYSNTLAALQVSTEDSVVPLWVERPGPHPSQIISFAGIMPNGYAGTLSSQWNGYRPGKIFRISFLARTPGVAYLSFGSDSRVYLNDGSGSEAPLSALGLSLSILPAHTRASSVSGWGMLIYILCGIIVLYFSAWIVLRLKKNSHDEV